MAGANSHHPDGPYEHGAMDVTEQVSTFNLFAGLMKWHALAFAVIILFLTLWFRPGGSFLGGLIPSAIMLALGVWYLRKPSTH